MHRDRLAMDRAREDRDRHRDWEVGRQWDRARAALAGSSGIHANAPRTRSAHRPEARPECMPRLRRATGRNRPARYWGRVLHHRASRSIAFRITETVDEW